MPSDTAAAMLSLVSAGLWGAGDFSGGVAARRANVFSVVAFALAVGVAVMAALALAGHEPLLSRRVVLFAAGAGISNGIALVSLYRALAVNKMGVTAPIAAVITAVLPVIFSSFTEGLPSALKIAGFALAFVSIWLIAAPQRSQGSSEGIGLAFLAGCGFSGFLVLIRYSGTTATCMPVAVARTASLLLVVGILLRQRRPLLPAGNAVWVSGAAGLFDSLGSVFFLMGAQRGRLDVAAVLASLYPASTVLLARLVLKERFTWVQKIGIAGALLAVVLIAAR